MLIQGSRKAILLSVLSAICVMALAQIPGDVDGDGDVDRADMDLILAARNTAASGPDDPRDIDGDGNITVLDARRLVPLCTRPRCANEPIASMPPSLRIADPLSGLVTAQTTLTVSGELSGEVDSVSVNGVAATLGVGTFSASGIALVEGTNTLVATAQNVQGGSASDSVSVRRDTSAPLVVIETPGEGDRLTSDRVTIAGTVNDIIPGATVNEDDVIVSVNGIAASVNNRSFILPDLALSPGSNVISAVAFDRAGNRAQTSIQITREADLAGVRFVIVGGNNQSGPINTRLPSALTVRAEDSDGQPLAGRPLTFEVSRGDGLLGDLDGGRRRLTQLTDPGGETSLDFTLGSRTGQGLHRVRVTTPGSLTSAEFCASGEPRPPIDISIADMPPMRGVAGQELTTPLSVIVTDDGGNPVPGVDVSFQVQIGGGDFGGQQQTIATTDPDGIARAGWTLGPEAGTANNEASADFPGNPGLAAVFTVSAFEPGALAATSVSGVVQDVKGAPIPGLRAIIRGAAQEAVTGADGRFTIFNVEPGGHRVGVLGSSADDPGAGIFYPDIDFAVEAVSGVDNPLDQIVVLPFLDMAAARLVGGDQDVELAMAGVPGFAIKVFANSVIRPDGSRGEIVMSSSQVKFDKVPMPPPQGGTPIVVGTLQPAGVRFDPPAQVTYPNVEGLSPGDVADIFAFHHDIGQFVNIGPGTVSEDGSVVVSDPGFGIVQSGWHCLIRLPGPKSNCANGCQARAEADGQAITQSSPVFMGVGDTKTVTVTFTPVGAIEGNWTSSDATKLDVAGGSSATALLTAKTAGELIRVRSPISRAKPEDRDQADILCQAEFDVTVIDIDADIDRDGQVEDNDEDEQGEESVGTLVIRDEDNVYSDPDEPAQRREIVVRQVRTRVRRSSNRLRLFNAKVGGAELYGNQEEIALEPGSYWLQGGADASGRVRDQSLRARADDDNAAFVDQINVTVLWVQISGRNSGSIIASPLFDGRSNAVDNRGHDKLGVQRSTGAGADGENRVRGSINVIGEIEPNDLSFDVDITSGFVDGNDSLNAGFPARADFGFIFRRIEDVKIYANGQGTVVQREDGNDDSLRDFQDVDPDRDGDKLLVVDIDGPTATVNSTVHFRHVRENFVEHTVFNFESRKPERCSKKLKWAFSSDVGLGFDNKAVFVRSAPNDGDSINEVKSGSHLASLDIGLVKAVLTSAQTAAGDKRIKRGQDVVVTVKGTNLIGRFILKKGATEIRAKLVQVKETDATNHVSDLKEVRATFNTNAGAGSGFELIVRNSAGDSNAIGGFVIEN